MGEVGIIGISILLLLSLIYVKKLLNNFNQERERARFILLSFLLIILLVQSLVDFSLHIPGIITLLILILSTGLVNYDKYKIVEKKIEND
jgi:O-antigen ligase